MIPALVSRPDVPVPTLRDVTLPSLGPADLRVRVLAASVDLVDTLVGGGVARAIFALTGTVGLGFSLTGTVTATGSAVTDRYVGRALELAGDDLTMTQIVAAISRATGRAVTYRAIPREALTGGDPDGIAGYEFGNERGGCRADIPMLGRLHPNLMDVDTWLTEHGVRQFTARSEPTGQPG